MDTNEQQVSVLMFSNFEIRFQDTVLNTDRLRSDMMTKLLVYMICHRKAPISVRELCDVLWQDDESDNPVGALKNLLYRLRGVLENTFGRKDFILTSRGAYAWNLQIDVLSDIEAFVTLIQQASKAQGEDIKINLLNEALRLYTGPFLPQLNEEFWIMQQSAHYHSLFITCVKNLATLYKKRREFELLEVLCYDALKFEELDEGIHCYLLETLVHQGKRAVALEQYKTARDLLYASLGTRPSNEMQLIYQQLLSDMRNEQLDLNVVQKELQEQIKFSGAYYCELGVFKEIYALQTKQAKRLGIAVHCALITIESVRNLPIGSKLYKRFEEQTMEILKAVILSTLRSGDVFARYSATQYMMILPTCDFEGGEAALRRIEENFYKLRTRELVKLNFDLKELDVS